MIAVCRVVVLVDNATYNHATPHAEWQRSYHATFCLHFLPPYSPDLYPVERVSKLLYRLWIHNRYFSSLLELTAAVDAQFEAWRRPKLVLKRLCSV